MLSFSIKISFWLIWFNKILIFFNKNRKIPIFGLCVAVSITGFSCNIQLKIFFQLQLRLEYFIAAAIAIIIILILVLVIVAVLLVRICRNRSALNGSSNGSTFSDSGRRNINDCCIKTWNKAVTKGWKYLWHFWVSYVTVLWLVCFFIQECSFL